MGVNFEAKLFSFACLTKKFAYGFDRKLLETALCQVSNHCECGMSTKKRENAAASDFVDKSFVKSVGRV